MAKDGWNVASLSGERERDAAEERLLGLRRETDSTEECSLGLSQEERGGRIRKRFRNGEKGVKKPFWCVQKARERRLSS